MKKKRQTAAWVTAVSTIATLVIAIFVVNRKRILNVAKGMKPGSNPAELSGPMWKAALLRTKDALKDKDLAASAAALAYYTTLSFFPVMLGVASLYIFIVGPDGVLSILKGLQSFIPSALYDVVRNEVMPLTESSRSKALVGLIVSIVALLWTTSGGVQNLVKATNKAYEVKEDRGFVRLRLISLLLGIVLLGIGGIILALLLLQGPALVSLGIPQWLASLFSVLRWPLLIVLVSLVLSCVYLYGPNRKEPHWQWVSWGATAATVVWLIATVLFFIYVQNFASYAKTYGIFAGIIVLMVWFNVSSLIILIGAQVNKKLEEVTPAPTQ